MFSTALRRSFICISIFLAAAVVRAAVWTGPASISLGGVGKSNFTLCSYWSVNNGSNYDTYCTVNLGNFSGSSYTQSGQAGVYIYYNGVHFTSSGWVADNVTIYEEDYNWSWTTTVYYNVSLPSVVNASGGGYWGEFYYDITTVAF